MLRRRTKDSTERKGLIQALIGGGLISIIIAALTKSKCSVCESYFTINETCFFCGKSVCGKCGTTLAPLGRICTNRHGDVQKALRESSSVTLYSENYKGKVIPPKYAQKIETAYYKDKDTAEMALKFLSAINGAPIVQSVHQTRRTESDGNFHFSVWSYRGTI